MNEKLKKKLDETVDKCVDNIGTIIKAIISVILVSLGAWWIFAPTSFWMILTFAGMIIGIPVIWETFGKGSVVWKFWGGLFGKGGRGVTVGVIYLALRGTIAYLVRFPLASSGGRLHENPLVTTIGFIHPSLLFEVFFAFLVGGMVYLWIFEKKKWAKVATISTMAVIAVGLTWYLAVNPRVINAAAPPISSYNMASAVKRNGVLGGTFQSLWRFLLGGSDAEASGQIVEIRPFILTSEKVRMTIEEGEMTGWLQSPSGKFKLEVDDGGFNFLTIDGRLIRSYERTNWPTNEPFQIIAVTRQNLGITEGL